MLTPKDRGLRIKQVYNELDRKYEELETERNAVAADMAYINLYGFPIDHQALSILPKETAEKLEAAIFYKDGPNLKLGQVKPETNLHELLGKLAAENYIVDTYVISQSSFNHLLDEYSKTVTAKRTVSEIKIDENSSWAKTGTLEELSKKLINVSTTEIIEALLGSALTMQASDVHLEPDGIGFKTRFRIDGVLQDVTQLSLEAQKQLISRIKIISKMKLNITAAPQDGSFSLTFNKKPIDVRVSILPSAFGESIVMRLLRQDKGQLNFDDLGIIGLAKERLLRQLEKPNGMILTTGPTGSGKTTTLYSILNKLNEPGAKIITLEDPVEYKIPGISQTPIDAKAGLTFAAGLRAILRQDPDIVMVGEMRDLETAETAAQASLTGHVVLSTLHTNDAPGAIPRLLDLGVKPFVLAPAINAIIAQRLVRKICPKCKTSYTPQQHLIDRVEMILKSIPGNAKIDKPKKLEFYHSPGCTECNGLGYKGRIGVYEVFTMNDNIEKLIIKQAGTSEIKQQAMSDGMITMAQDGILKALTGITDIEEVFRVTED
jgi:type II secretory ATPase GspE/PulE/Tfp pilus assembly ATPase PilB-like protein